MRVLTSTRGTQEWRELHAGKVSASDVDAALSRRGSKKYAKLVDRLVHDFEVPNHTTEHPDPWHERHEEDLRAAVSSYRTRHEPGLLTTGLCSSDQLGWLVASPHGLVGNDGSVHLRIRRHLHTFSTQRHDLSERAFAQCQVIMFVCDRRWLDLVDYWDGRGDVPDRFSVRRIAYDYAWLADNVLHRLVTLWHDVAAQRTKRSKTS